MRVAGVETEIHVAENVAIRIGTGSQAVVVANYHHIRHVEPLHNVALKHKLLGGTKVTHVATVHHKVDVGARVDAVDRHLHLVVPALRVADYGKCHLVAIGAPLFYQADVFTVDVVCAANFCVVGVVVDQVAPREHRAAHAHSAYHGKYILFHVVGQ